MNTPALLLLLFACVVFGLIYYLRKTAQDINRKHLTYNDPAFPDIKKLLNVINSIQDGLIIFDRKHNPIYLNNQSKTFLGLSPEPNFSELSSKFEGILKLDTKLDEVMDTNKQDVLHEVAIGNYSFDISISPYTDEGHHPDRTGVTLLLKDISYEKNIEKVKEDFSHVIVHELRAPIAAIKDASSMLIKQELKPDLQVKMLTLINEQSHKLLVQVGSILDAAKLDDGKLKLNIRPSDVTRVVQEEIDLFLAEAERKKINLTVQYGQNIPQVNIDPIRIAQTLSNLISNALKYTNEGGQIRVSVDTDDSYKNNSKGNLIIKVSDTGAGITDAIKANLFKKFSDIGTTNKETTRLSSGLGLYITKGIVEAHNGQILVDSVVGKGTTFTCIIPI